tara:strand:+ start:612 stop:770 length:159 start_codon:yes stop_codon:yes gene_type:complete
MIEKIAIIFGILFVCLIISCLIITIIRSILEHYSPNNKLEDNIKQFDKINKR